MFDIKGDDQILITQMIRELLSNVVQHSGVLKAEVRAECSNKQIVITVIDKGRGFDPDKDVSKQSVIAKFGLFSVRERLNLIGGELKIVSSTGNGTECTIIYPYGKCYQRKNV